MCVFFWFGAWVGMLVTFWFRGQQQCKPKRTQQKPTKSPITPNKSLSQSTLSHFEGLLGANSRETRLTLRRGPRDARNHLKALGAREV